MAYASSALWGVAGNWPRYNPDILLTRQGADVYDRMANDEQIKAVLKFKRDAILSRQWSFQYEETTTLTKDEQEARIEILCELVKRMKGSFTDSLAYIMRAMRHGYSLTEKIFDLVDVDGKAYYACTELRPKPPFSFYFKTDEFGNLIDFGQNYGGALRSLNLAKFIHYVQDPDEDQWFGRSELRAAYRSWYSKDVLIKMQALWLERMGGGFIVVTRDKDAPDPSASDMLALNNAIANVKSLSGIILPPGFVAQVVSPPSTEAFTSAIEYHDLAMAKALLVPNLLGVSHTGKTGAYAQSQTQLEAFFWTLNADSSRLQATLDEQLFYEICELNFGDGQYPCFKFKPASEEFIKWVVGQWTTLVGANSVVTTEADEAHLRRILNMPARGPEDEPLVTPAQEQAQKNQEAQLAVKAGSSLSPGSGAKSAPTGSTDSENYSRRKVVAHTKDGKPRSCSVAAFTRAVQRVAFSVIEQKTESLAANTRKDMANVMANSIAKIVKGTPEMLADPASIQDIKFGGGAMRELNAVCKDALQRGWDLGQRQGANEINRAINDRGHPNIIHASRRTFGALRNEAAAAFLEANSFRMAANLADGSRAIIQQELLNGVKGNLRPEVVSQNIYRRLIKKGFVTLEAIGNVVDSRDVVEALQEALGTSSEADTAAYLDTLARTNIFEAVNEARFAEFTDPALQGFVEALEYSAILDDRTTEICQTLDGFTANTDSNDWDTYKPPNHYNCRSLLIPVTQVDGWDGQDDPTPNIEPQEGFGAGTK